MELPVGYTSTSKWSVTHRAAAAVTFDLCQVHRSEKTSLFVFKREEGNYKSAIFTQN